MPKFELHQGECMDVLRGMADCSVDAIVCDPPYGIRFMGKHWDYDVPGVDVWAECLRVLKPGGHLLAFAGTRTLHRMAVRIEDAGFEIRDMIAWVYGSGFPKSLDVSKAIDKAAGAEREVVGFDPTCRLAVNRNMNDDGWQKIGQQGAAITAPATDAARQWQGWGTALKPALEPITVARKPLVGTVAVNVLTHGTGALNIDGCRVGVGDDRTQGGATGKRVSADEGYMGSWSDASEGRERPTGGRWPANLIHDGSDEVLAGFPASIARPAAVVLAGGESGTEKYEANVYGGGFNRACRVGYQDKETSAARFFYCAKASRADRNDGTETLPQRAGGMVSNTSGQHITRRDEGYEAKPQGNHHPTVKPTDLMAYLCRLVTPPGGVVLDPFMGSGSTGKACMLEGFDFIGIERDRDEQGNCLGYIDIARARIQHALDQVTAAAAQPQLFVEAA